MLRTWTRAWIGGLGGAFALALTGLGCGGDPDAGDKGIDDGAPAVRARFDLGPSPVPWGAIPWPDDLYLDDGHIAVTSLPIEPAELRETLADALATLDGAGLRPTIV